MITAIVMLHIDKLKVKEFRIRRRDCSFYRRASQSIDGVQNESDLFLISYMSEFFSDVAQVPSLVLDALTEHRLKVTTMLASGRYYIDSNRVAM